MKRKQGHTVPTDLFPLNGKLVNVKCHLQHWDIACEANETMQSSPDMFLGWTNDSPNKFNYIRQLPDAKVKSVLEIMKAKNMAD